MKKEKKILVTAHIKNSKINSSTILLTTFCNSFDINDYYKNQKLLCANYHWNSKKKFLKEQKYLYSNKSSLINFYILFIK